MKQNIAEILKEALKLPQDLKGTLLKIITLHP